MTHIRLEKITIAKPPIHDAWCECRRCTSRGPGILERYLPSAITGIGCASIALAAIIINILAFT